MHNVAHSTDSDKRRRERYPTRPRLFERNLCLLGGIHSPDSPWRAECPLVNAQKRSEQAKKAAVIRWRARSEARRAFPQSDGAGDAQTGQTEV